MWLELQRQFRFLYYLVRLSFLYHHYNSTHYKELPYNMWLELWRQFRFLYQLRLSFLYHHYNYPTYYKELQNSHSACSRQTLYMASQLEQLHPWIRIHRHMWQ